MDDLATRKNSFFAVNMLYFWVIVTALFWGLAFFPIDTSTPEWLMVAKTVCFGTTANGLPDSSGWMLLTLSPLSMLVAIWVIWHEQLKQEIFLLRQGTKGKWVLGGLIILPLLILVWAGNKIAKVKQNDAQFLSRLSVDQKETFPENYPMQHQTIPEFSLVSQKGEQVNPEIFKGQITLFTFVFAHCDTMCPMVLQNALAAIKNSPGLKPQLVAITLDPWRDTPSSLVAATKKWGFSENMYYLSGEIDQVNGFIDAMKYPRQRNLKSGEVTHPGLIHVVGPDGYIIYTFNNPSATWLSEAMIRVQQKKTTAR